MDKVLSIEPEHFEEENVAPTPPPPPPPQVSLPLCPGAQSPHGSEQGDHKYKSSVAFFQWHSITFIPWLSSLLWRRDSIPVLLLVRTDLLIPSTFLTLYLGLIMHHLHC